MSGYERLEDVPEEQIKALGEGVVVVGRKLREWREYASLASITARWESADKSSIEITCDGEDRIWLRAGTQAEPLEFTDAIGRFGK